MHFQAMPTSHLFEVTLAANGSELSSTKVPKLSRRYHCLKNNLSIMTDPSPNAWTCPDCNCYNINCACCAMCATARPKGSHSVLLVDKNHPAVVAVRRGQRQPPKARSIRGAAPCESPPQDAKEKVNQRIATQLAQCTTMPVAEVVPLPESSPDGPLVPPPAAASAGAGLVDVTAEDLDNDNDSPVLPLRGLGRKTTGLELGDSRPNFSPHNSLESPIDNKVGKYSFLAQLTHYLEGNKISKANCAAVEVCILVEAGAAVYSMDPMKKDKKEKVFFNKYMGILEEIEDDQFENYSVREAMCHCYKKANFNINSGQLWRKCKSDLTKLRNFVKKLPDVGSLSELPSGSNQLRHMKMHLVHKLWIEKHPV